MKRVLIGTFLAAAFAVGLSAQTPPQSTTPPQSPSPQAQSPTQDRDAAKTVTVIGCLKAGDSADSYMLSDLKWSKDKSSGAVGTSGSAAAAPPAAFVTATTIKLVPAASAKLSDHVGHQIEVTGTADKASSTASPTAAPADPASARPSASSAAPALEVRSVKMIAATCSDK